MDKYTVAIVDDDILLLESISEIIVRSSHFRLVLASSDSSKVVHSIMELNPDILIVDINMPVVNGIDIIQQIRKENQQMLIQVLTINEDSGTVFSAIKAGAHGYLLKGLNENELIDALMLLADGGSPMSPKIARQVISFFHPSVSSSNISSLSTRETEVLQLIDKAFTYKEIGSKLNISPHTVHVHIKNIYEKLHAKNRAEALLKAKENNIL